MRIIGTGSDGHIREARNKNRTDVILSKTGTESEDVTQIFRASLKPRRHREIIIYYMS